MTKTIFFVICFISLISVLFGFRSIPIRVRNKRYLDTTGLLRLIPNNQSVIIKFQNVDSRRKTLHVEAKEGEFTHKIDCRIEFSIQVRKYKNQVYSMKKRCKNEEINLVEKRFLRLAIIFLKVIAKIVGIVKGVKELQGTGTDLCVKYQEIMLIIILASLFKYIFKKN